jgi:hypothetical protein
VPEQSLGLQLEQVLEELWESQAHAEPPRWLCCDRGRRPAQEVIVEERERREHLG